MTGWTREERTAALQAWASTSSVHVLAAVELLIEHDTWMRRQDFIDAAVIDHPNEGMATIRWGEAAAFAEQARGSTTEIAMLHLAIALGRDTYRLAAMGTVNGASIVDAVARAVGAR